MLTEYEVVDSDDWWLVRLATQMGEGFERLEKLRKYRDGDALLPDESISVEEREAYLKFYRMNRLHVVELLRNARTAKQRVIGFRTGAPDDEDGDLEAWRIWRASQMKRNSHSLFDKVADYGKAYVITTPMQDENQKSRFEITDGWTTAVEPLYPGSARTKVAIRVRYDALTQSDQIMFWRYDPATGQVRLRVAAREVGEFSQIPQDGSTWVPGNDWDWVPLGSGEVGQYASMSVPVTELSTPDGVGVWERHLDTIDRVNYLSLQTMQLIVTQTFRQSAVSSDQLPAVYPDDDPFGRGGQPVDYTDVFKTGPSALWRLPGDAKVHQFTPVDPRPLREQRDDEIRKLAAFTSTPYYMLSSDSANNSAEGASLASETLLTQVEKMNDFAETSVEQIMALAFEFEQDQARATPGELETMWAPLTRASLSEIGAAAQQAKQGGATQRYIDENIFGMSPGERRQAVLDRQEEALFSTEDTPSTSNFGLTDSAADTGGDVNGVAV